jgi:hypothetical protein
MMGSRTDNVIEDMLDPVGLGAGEDEGGRAAGIFNRNRICCKDVNLSHFLPLTLSKDGLMDADERAAATAAAEAALSVEEDPSQTE